MARLEKLYMRVASAGANARFEDVVRLAEAVGFVWMRTKGSHQVFYHLNHPELRLILQERHGKAKPYQVMDLLRMIEKTGLRRW